LIRNDSLEIFNWLTSGEKEHLLFPQGAQSPREVRACALVVAVDLGALAGPLIEVGFGAVKGTEDESSVV